MASSSVPKAVRKLPACRPCWRSQRTIAASQPWVTMTRLAPVAAIGRLQARPVGVIAEHETAVQSLAPARPARLIQPLAKASLQSPNRRTQALPSTAGGR